jgi:hypothetical protein
MTEQTPQDEAREEKQRPEPRDAAFWAQRIERLEVSDVPEGAANVNVQGRREVGALQGFGQLWQKTYRVRLAGIETTPEEVVRVWKERFPELQPPNSRFYPSLAGVAPGEVLFISASVGGMPVHTGVRVIYADDESFTVMTPEGHPESGWNTFSAYQDDDGTTQQERIWTHVLKSLAAHFDVNEPVTLEKACVDPKLQWSQVMNIWQNAGARSMLYTITAPLRWRRNKSSR